MKRFLTLMATSAFASVMVRAFIIIEMFEALLHLRLRLVIEKRRGASRCARRFDYFISKDVFPRHRSVMPYVIISGCSDSSLHFSMLSKTFEALTLWFFHLTVLHGRWVLLWSPPYACRTCWLPAARWLTLVARNKCRIGPYAYAEQLVCKEDSPFHGMMLITLDFTAGGNYRMAMESMVRLML